MTYSLQQIVVPVAVLGSQPDEASFDDWVVHFTALLTDMRAAMPCRGNVRVSEDVAARIYGENLPATDPGEKEILLTVSSEMRLYLDRELPENTVRLE